jgi:hypothetical protein
MRYRGLEVHGGGVCLRLEQGLDREERQDVGTEKVGIIGTGLSSFHSGARSSSRLTTTGTRTALKVKAVFKPIVDEQTIVQALGSGEIDFTFNLSGKSFVQLQGFNNVELVTGPSFNVAYLGINTKKAPWSDKRVRQAIAYSLDRQGILEACYANQGKAWVPPITDAQWFTAPDVFQKAYDALPKYEKNLEKAKQLTGRGPRRHGEVWSATTTTCARARVRTRPQLGMTIDEAAPSRKVRPQPSGEPRTDMTITIWDRLADPAGNIQVPSTPRTSSRTSPSMTT